MRKAVTFFALTFRFRTPFYVVIDLLLWLIEMIGKSAKQMLHVRQHDTTASPNTATILFLASFAYFARKTPALCSAFNGSTFIP